MKRSWFGAVLLIVLLILSIAAAFFMTRLHEDLALEARLSADSALLGQWDDVHLLLRRISRRWDRFSGLRSCLTDHEALEAIDATLAQMEVCRQSKNALHYQLLCAQLQTQLTALGEAHTLTWRNLL